MRALIRYIVLPSEITDFEREYLARINRIALQFFLLHPAVFMLVAWANGTSVVDALWMTLLVLSGPVVAARVFSNPRSVSVVLGITAMFMGGLLVHFGQGPVQIEMHFYFFVLLALLAVTANPMTIVAAAGTAAVHHALLWFVAPESVFNYDAPIWVVGVHALFVVLESVAACFVARGFFDNVIGLDKIVQARTSQLDARNQDMRLILDNVAQGFVSISRDGTMSAERSAIVTEWFGESDSSQTIWEMIGAVDARAGVNFEMNFESITDGYLPLELTLDQMPTRMTRNGQHWGMEYQPLLKDEELEGLVVIFSDVTAQVEAERMEREQRELLGLFNWVSRDRAGTVEFYEEAARLVQSLTTQAATGTAEIMRQVHTLKGNCSLFGITGVAQVCHDIESKMRETDERPDVEQLETLRQMWERLSISLGSMLGDSRGQLEVKTDEYEAILDAIEDGTTRPDLAYMMSKWQQEPTKRRLERIADQAKSLAQRLNKGDIEVQVEHGGLRLSPDAWTPFWSAFSHVVRNAIDHGLESPSERTELGKSQTGKITLRTFVDGEDLVVELGDDGAGVNWEAIEDKASELGLPIHSQDALEAAIFAEGLTTKQEVTDTSGRGVGMSAVKLATEEMGGRIQLETSEGQGTTFQFRLPKSCMDQGLRKLDNMKLRAHSMAPGRRAPANGADQAR